MIVTCEQCQARYLVASLLLGTAGRQVKCGVCGHSWYQVQPEEMVSDNIAGDTGQPGSFSEHLARESLDPIPEGVRPIPEGSSVPALKGRKLKFRPQATWAKIISSPDIRGGALASGIVLIIFAGLVSLHGPLVRAWPAADLLFRTVGITTALPGENLIFGNVSAMAGPGQGGKPVLTLAGNITSVGGGTIAIPAIQAVLQNGKAALPGGIFIVPAKKATITSGSTVPFTATFQSVPKDATSVTVHFLAGAPDS